MISTPWLVRRAGPARPFRLYCFSYAGGGASVFSAWHHGCGPEVELCAVQLPGREERMGEACVTAFAPLVRTLAQQIAFQGVQRFAFFGHSLGALLAFEVARYCALHYLPGPQQLIVSGCGAPRLRARSRNLHQLDDDGLIDQLRAYSGTLPEVLEHAELMSLLLPIVRADFALAHDYAYRTGPRLAIPITVLAGRQDEHVSAAQAEGWSAETSAGCQVHWFDGGHMFINSHGPAVRSAVAGALVQQCEEIC